MKSPTPCVVVDLDESVVSSDVLDCNGGGNENRWDVEVAALVREALCTVALGSKDDVITPLQYNSRVSRQ